MDLTGKVAVVTGSGRGLGRAYAVALAAAGAAVVVNDVDRASAEEVRSAITSAGGRAASVVAPVSSTETADELVATAVEEFGRLDAMVTNAGILRDKTLWKMGDDDFDAVIDVHVRGTFTCARAAVTRMRAQGEGGRLVLVSSPAGQRGNFGQTNYAAAKAAIVAMARTWAMELARDSITANAIVPVAATEMTKTVPAFGPTIEEAERTGAPLPRWMRHDAGLGSVEDVAPLVVFLASDASAAITGQAIGIGGDKLALWSHPEEKDPSYLAGGWSADAIATTWAPQAAADQESYGITLPTGGQ